MTNFAVTDQYQLLPPLADDDYERLKADIAVRGVMVAVEFDEDGNVLDGHHRLRIAKELGIADALIPSIVRLFQLEFPGGSALVWDWRRLGVCRGCAPGV